MAVKGVAVKWEGLEKASRKLRPQRTSSLLGMNLRNCCSRGSVSFSSLTVRTSFFTAW